MPSEAKTASNEALNLVSRSWIKYLIEGFLCSSAHTIWRACWGYLFRIRVGRATRKMDAPGTKLDKEQDINSFEPGGFNGEEITGQHLILIMGQEGLPRHAIAMSFKVPVAHDV